MNLLLLNYNNYFNRQLKKTNLDGYYAFHPKVVPWTGEFNYNDGVNTSVVLATDNIPYDYLVVVDDSNVIVSRWFIADTSRVSRGKIRCELKRDLIADYYTQIVDADCFIEKGHVSEDNPLIFNKENFECNQIKDSEILLRDKAYISWIAIYYNPSGKSRLSGSIERTALPFVNIGTTLEAWDIYTKYGTNGYKKPIDTTKKIQITVDNTDFLQFLEDGFLFNNNLTLEKRSQIENDDTELQRDSIVSGETIKDAVKNCIARNRNNIKTQLENLGKESDDFDSINSWNGVLIKTSDNKFYRVKINAPLRGNYAEKVNSGTLFNAISDGFKSGDAFYNGFSGSMNNSIYVSYDYDVYGVTFEGPLTNTSGVTINYNFTQIDDLKDEPYGLIMLPYKSLDPYGRNIEDVEDDISLEIATQMAIAGVGANKDIFDIQIVPYCPMKEIVATPLVNNIQMSFNGLTEDVHYKIIRDSNNNRVSFAIFPKFAKFTELIDARTKLTTDLQANKYDKKVDNQCCMYRLCSPNYSGQFEFSASKNNGLDYFNVDCTYKPFQPYIHINPLWSGLYGKDFNDARGLVCGGDFSISVMSDTFEEYKLQNKNFEIAFDREIEHLDTSFDISNRQALTNLAISTGKGAVGGALAGANPLTIGLGAATGLTSGLLNMNATQQAYKENRDYAIDMHNYQLSNVKAQPNGLVKITAYTNNNKVFPFIEKYTCTDEEIEIFKSKLKYEGMTVNAIGKISQYLNPNEEETFIKAKPLRILGISEDSHMLYSIYEELEKGYYFREVTE